MLERRNGLMGSGTEEPETESTGAGDWVAGRQKDFDDVEDFLTLGKSETNLRDFAPEKTAGTSLAMWESEIQDIELEKGERGLGFSILDYQPLLTRCTTGGSFDDAKNLFGGPALQGWLQYILSEQPSVLNRFTTESKAADASGKNNPLGLASGSAEANDPGTCGGAEGQVITLSGERCGSYPLKH
ncbi:Multiple PDZ domain protein [Bagarius yarrelli]|uniref:Multiple PDZ domain protein n=1 Tax=Bagarius yarrelli TaxID=175774 RepID=A0A556TZW3_BAGYA|nr:Multiple PDZ domain protein [Bagarius yarrelli]